MLIWINTSGKWQKATILEFKPKFVQLPSEWACRVYATYKLLNNGFVGDTYFIDAVNWFPVSQKQWKLKCDSVKLPNAGEYYGEFMGFRPK
jgi:hypothetical protein